MDRLTGNARFRKGGILTGNKILLQVEVIAEVRTPINPPGLVRTEYVRRWRDATIADWPHLFQTPDYYASL